MPSLPWWWQCHAGPTGSVGAGFDVVVQYFTSRGFAVAAVDYAGSTGYGRAYRCSLWGQWGVATPRTVSTRPGIWPPTGRVDGIRMAVRGSSSGGLTALNALADGESLRRRGVVVRGHRSAAGWPRSPTTSRRTTWIGWSAPCPSAGTYEARSPVRRAGEISGSVLLLQGLDDPVVPPAQTERLRDALLARGRHCEVRFFEGEGHGFRRAETVRAAPGGGAGLLPARARSLKEAP